ncbi:hypothetical protein DXG03_006329 [Asterophora parasitica]|uniref:Uncharacterized protein n=1 Tax=Asterophora parasitica TaxID=117018 RepID=A0A9P7KEY9_9AGAR|nr:hypothetical protein DXG03_006329 [Asterophora parasitica]
MTMLDIFVHIDYEPHRDRQIQRLDPKAVAHEIRLDFSLLNYPIPLRTTSSRSLRGMEFLCPGQRHDFRYDKKLSYREVECNPERERELELQKEQRKVKASIANSSRQDTSQSTRRSPFGAYQTGGKFGRHDEREVSPPRYPERSRFSSVRRPSFNAYQFGGEFGRDGERKVSRSPSRYSQRSRCSPQTGTSKSRWTRIDDVLDSLRTIDSSLQVPHVTHSQYDKPSVKTGPSSSYYSRNVSPRISDEYALPMKPMNVHGSVLEADLFRTREELKALATRAAALEEHLALPSLEPDDGKS